MSYLTGLTETSLFHALVFLEKRRKKEKHMLTLPFQQGDQFIPLEQILTGRPITDQIVNGIMVSRSPQSEI